MHCATEPAKRLAGSWKVVSITSKAPLPDYNVDDFRFLFTEDGRYEYFGNLYYHEAGRFYVEASYLFTSDTLNAASGEKAVQIMKLTRDSLVLRMADETVMRMTRN